MIHYWCVYVLFYIAFAADSSDSSLKLEKFAIDNFKNASMDSMNEVMTTLLGHPVADKTNILTMGPRGPAILSNMEFIEEMAHFDRERIPERVVHARGAGAFGYFKVTQDITKYCKAAIFSKVGKETPVAVRFSTVTGELGSPDTVFGDPRGFAVKFYTEEGNWDLVGNNVPMFFVRDPNQFSSLVHSQKRHPQTGCRDPNSMWDFISLRPETLHLVTFLFSDFGIPDGWRHMPGFSINAFKFVNSSEAHFFVKFHWITNQGIKNLDNDMAARYRAEQPDYARKDLFEAIEAGNYPSWTLKIQIMTEEDTRKFEYNPFDATKIWPVDRYPLIEVGVMTLNRNPTNFFAEVEQIALCPGNLVCGIEPSPDKLLIGRIFSYPDTHRYRLGANHHLIQVNQAKNRVLTPTQRDGAMRVDGNFGSLPHYFPNSYSKVSDNPKYHRHRYGLPTNDVHRYESKNEDNYCQVKDTYYGFPEDMRKRLHRNIALSMKGAHPTIQSRAIDEISKVDANYGLGVWDELKKIKL